MTEDEREMRHFILNAAAHQAVLRLIMEQILRHHPIDLSPVWTEIEAIPDAAFRGNCSTLLASIAENAAATRRN